MNINELKREYDFILSLDDPTQAQLDRTAEIMSEMIDILAGYMSEYDQNEIYMSICNGRSGDELEHEIEYHRDRIENS